jgi:hypothetical protein
MRFEIADWRFEVTWDGLLCQPIERGRAKAAKKSAAQSNRSEGRCEGRREGARKSDRHAIGLAVQTFNKQTSRKIYSTGSGSDLVMKEPRNEFD